MNEINVDTADNGENSRKKKGWNREKGGHHKTYDKYIGRKSDREYITVYALAHARSININNGDGEHLLLRRLILQTVTSGK